MRRRVSARILRAISLVVAALELLRTNVLPPEGFEAGYKQWQDARGGLFTIDVDGMLDMMLKRTPGI